MVDTICFWYWSVSSLKTWSLRRKTYWLIDLHVPIDRIWRYMIRLGISFNILWTSMRILSCYDIRRLHHRSCEYFISRSHGVLSRSMMNTFLISIIDCTLNHIWYLIFDLCISTFLSRLSCLSSSTHLLQIVGYYDHVHWQSSTDTKSKMSQR